MKDDIIRMAREAGLNVGPAGMGQTVWGSDTNLERFFHMAQAAEREACCNLLEGMHVVGTGSHNYYLHAATELRRLRDTKGNK